MKNIEVELRALISDFNNLKIKIEALNAGFVNKTNLHDIYFCDKKAKDLSEVEMHDVGSYSLRLRKNQKNGQVSITLNTKSITNEGDHHAWEEHESKVDDFEETFKILIATEFKPFFELIKTRYTYQLDEFTVCLEDITDFGACIEIEVMSTPENQDEAKQKIRELLLKLGIEGDAIVPKSITNIVMHQRAFKQEINLNSILPT